MHTCPQCSREVSRLFNGICAQCVPAKKRPRIGRPFFHSTYQYFRAKSNDVIKAMREGDFDHAQHLAEKMHKQLLIYGEEVRVSIITGEKRG